MPLTLALSRWWKGEKEDEKILTMPPHPDPLPRWGEGKKEKDLTASLTFVLSRKGREEKKDGKVLMDKIKGELGNGRVMAGL